MKLTKILLLLTLILTLSSCNKYLEEPPSKSTAIVPETIEDLDALLNSYNSFISEPSNELIMGSDDYGFNPDLYDASQATYSTTEAIYGLWDTDLAAEQNGRIFWPVEWQKIFTANLILQTLGSVEGTEEQKANLEAECHFIKAYSYFEMATVYCLPYTGANGDELGLPIKMTTSFEESVERASLGETYDFIKEELEKATQLTTTLKEVNGMEQSWRASTAAVNAFAARFYLSLNDYSQAQSYAQKALDEYDYVKDYNTEMRYSDVPHEVTIFDPDPTQVNIDFPYTVEDRFDMSVRFGFGEFYYYRQLENAGWKNWPSQDLLDSYDQDNDLRYKYHMVENYSYDQGSAIDPPYGYPGYIFFFRDALPSGPSVPEMILVKAECQARQGNWQEGLNTLNTMLRPYRIDNTAPANKINLTANSPDEALKEILAERRRELPFVLRWYDLRRYNNNETSVDDVTITRDFYPFNSSTILGSESRQTYTLEPHSRKYAYPIPTTDINASNGQIEQNTY